MELTIERKTIPTLFPLPVQYLSAEGAADCTVPDTLPDVARVLRADCALQSVNLSAGDGKLGVSAVGDVCVLYRDGDGGLQVLRVQVPLRAEGALKETGPAFARIRVRRVDCASPNARKLSVRLFAVLSAETFREESVSLPESVEAEAVGLELLRRETTLAPLFAARTERFEETEELELPAAAPAPEALLCLTCEGAEISCKPVPGKLVLKGDLIFRGEYLSGGALQTADWRIPFTRVAEIDGVTEETKAFAALSVESVSARVQEGERAVEASAAGCLHLLLWNETRVSFPADAYSTTHALSVSPCDAALWDAGEPVDRCFPLRETVESDLARITGASGEILSLRRADGRITGEIAVELQGERDGESGGLCRRVAFDLPLEGEIALLTARVGRVSASVASGGADVQAELCLSGLSLARRELRAVGALEVGEALPCTEEAPLLSLCRVRRGDRLFDLGRSLRAPMGRIFAANGLEPCETAPEDRILIVPRT